MSGGYVYVLSNPTMPNVAKIGYSKHGGKSRADIFYKNDTAVATPFDLEFEIWSRDARRLEGRVHDYLSAERINLSREFFDCTPADAKAAILNVDAQSSHPYNGAVVPLDLSEGGVFDEVRYLGSKRTKDLTFEEYFTACQRIVNDPEAILEKIEKIRKTNAYWSELASKSKRCS